LINRDQNCPRRWKERYTHQIKFEEAANLSFLDLNLKPSYDSDGDDVLNEFYIPVLSRAKRYHRLAGFFTSSALAVASRGISDFINHEGQMKLIVGARLQKSDVDAISEGKETPEKVLSENMLNDLGEIEDQLVKDHVSALAWLVAKGCLDIKVAVVFDSSGCPLDYEGALQRGIFHLKIGILEDQIGNFVSFSGSINETAAAWKDNIEEFKVFRSWIAGEIPHLESDSKKFEKYWYGQTDRMKVFDVPTAVRQKLIEMAPADIRNLHLNSIDKKPTLREYQKNAINAWLENCAKGIFEMATATGKTFTAISGYSSLLKREKKLATVITVPFIHLTNQWTENLKVFGFDSLDAFSDSSKWTGKLANTIFNYNNDCIRNMIVVTTHDTFSSSKFTNLIGSISGNILLIADEVHGLGSPERQKGLLDIYNYRLGLSATPSRWFDEEGTQTLMSYFDKVVFEFSLKKAIESGFLSKYEYFPHFVELDPQELEEYKKITKKIVIEYYNTKNRAKRSEIMNLFCILRQRIIVNSSEKYQALNRILDETNDLDHCLIYCSPQQIDQVQGILNSRGIIQHKFTAEENLSERKILLDSFDKGHYRVLVAMKCLDEGVDVPSTTTAILMASSTNPREFIQRRGRILRLYPGKNCATIHDIIVVPTITGNIDPDFFDLESKIMGKEISRYIEFADSATNSGSAYAQIAPIATKYHITLEN
jgi:superfamily II DNA or RNA helicase